MKTFAKIVAAALTACLAVCSASPVNAADTDTFYDILIPIEDTPFALSFNSDEEMFKYIRSQLILRNENIKAVMSNTSSSDLKKYSDTADEEIFKDTGDPTEGVYLRQCLVHEVTAVSNTENGVMIHLTTQYLTTVDQEQELNEAIFRLKHTHEFIAASSLDAYGRIKWAYDKVVSEMKLSQEPGNNSFGSAYSAMIRGEANEHGQTHLLIRLLSELGIHCDMRTSNEKSISDDEADCHYLVIAEINGKSYFLDPVWEYSLGGSGSRFFLKGYKDLDSENEGLKEYTHIHLHQYFGLPDDMVFATLNISPTAYDPSQEPVFTCGDVDGDGSINSVDASLVLSEYARRSSQTPIKTFSSEQEEAADIDGNSLIDSVDASAILSYYSYLSTLKDGETAKDIQEFRR